MMEKKRSVGVTVVGYSIIIIGLIYLLLPFLFKGIFEIWLMKELLNYEFIICIFLSVIHIISGIGVLKLKSLARIVLIAISAIYSIILLPAFSMWFIFGMYTGGFTGDDAHWAPTFTLEFWQQLVIFILYIMFLGLPLLLSIFYIYYLTRSKVKEQFK